MEGGREKSDRVSGGEVAEKSWRRVCALPRRTVVCGRCAGASPYIMEEPRPAVH
ncbi:hypothetical protein E2C01_051379 [Portunus trituberculatus]|uniref:Uncharacterized protein n=1 Tax=Portunus trituberculatus TaxID=210409 RepID=A0A5B7GAU2_PORTR|nr:hypothetical protein [Portunus trituberculatus]